MQTQEQLNRSRLIIQALSILTELGFWDEVKTEFRERYLNALENQDFDAERERQRLLGVQQVLDSMSPRIKALKEAEYDQE